MPRSGSPVIVLLLLLGGLLGTAAATGPKWGFFGHRRINRLATFTLPPEMMPAFRARIDYLSEHAVDPDKRRYASAGEAVRHYIDLDHWGSPPFDRVARDYAGARISHSRWSVIGPDRDTLQWTVDTIDTALNLILLSSPAGSLDFGYHEFRRLWFTTVSPALSRELPINRDSLRAYGFPVADGSTVMVTEEFSRHGILPYHLLAYHRRLTQAFVDRDAGRVFQLAAEMGHYVGDAHVPLHTTENYNGQLTGQLGIHAFWESRLPELMADTDYDLWVGPAEYITDPRDYYWNIVLGSHELVDSVLNTERRLRERFPGDRQRCYEERSGRIVAQPCEAYARAWSAAMNGMVEERFRAAVHAVGSVWYSCWVDAGQPDLDGMLNEDWAGTQVPSNSHGRVNARPHE
jgi:hypothetical protein